MDNNLKIIIIIKSYLLRKSISELLLEEFNHIELIKDLKDYDDLISTLERQINCIVVAEGSVIKKIERYFQALPANITFIPILENSKDRDNFTKYKEILTVTDEKKLIVEVLHRSVNSLPPIPLTNTKNQKELSARETIILQLIAKGLSSKMIAEKLCISIQTVSTHRKNISNKLEIKTVSGLTLYAIMNNLIKSEETF